jgi:hypothetical protein
MNARFVILIIILWIIENALNALLIRFRTVHQQINAFLQSMAALRNQTRKRRDSIFKIMFVFIAQDTDI